MPTADEPAALPLTGMPVPPPKPPTAADLVAAWCDGWSTTHGEQPDPSVLKRVRGICKAVAADRTDMESWRTAWRAAKAAGARGRYDVVGELAQPVAMNTGRANHYLTLARGSDQTAAALTAAFTRSELGA